MHGPRYENPLITATSRALISDIHALTRHCCAVDVPRPLSLLHTILRAHPPNKLGDDPWFKAIRVWAEVDDISETESFGASLSSLQGHVCFTDRSRWSQEELRSIHTQRPLLSGPSYYVQNAPDLNVAPPAVFSC